MQGRVIQGFFVGGQAPRLPGAAPSRALQRAAAPIGEVPGPPRPAFAATARTMQAHGGAGNFEVDPVQVGLARGGGQALPPPVLAKMEAAFGADFSNVRIHIGPQAARIGAIAFTTGSDIYFAPGRYQPNSMPGQQLLGHELAHVVQQRQGRVRSPTGGVSVVQDRALEAEADRLGARAAAHIALQPKMAHAAGAGQVRVSAPVRDREGRYRLRAELGGRSVGSLMVDVSAGRSALVTDLGVEPAHRSKGIGKMLLESAARTGLRFGKPMVALTADDNGSGKLNRWYGGLGFARAGVDSRGRPKLEAPVGQVLAGAAQPKMAAWSARVPGPPAASRPGPPVPVIQRAKAPQKSAAVTLMIGGVPYTGKSSGEYGHAEMAALRKFIVAQPSFAAAAAIINAGGSTVSCLIQPVCGSCKRVLEALSFTAAADGTELSTDKSGGVSWGASLKVADFMAHMGQAAAYKQALADGAK